MKQFCNAYLCNTDSASVGSDIQLKGDVQWGGSDMAINERSFGNNAIAVVAHTVPPRNYKILVNCRREETDEFKEEFRLDVKLSRL